MQAKIVKSFLGVEDGKIYPRRIEIGEIVEGDLAAVAIKEKWGTEHRGAERGAETHAPAKEEAPKAEDKADEKPAEVAIPANWKSLKLVDLRALAAQFTDGDIADPKKAASVIEAELAKRKG